VDFVPGEAYEAKDSRPLRYVRLRLLKPQGLFFADGSDRHFHAVITNQREMDGGRLLQWHREKAGTLEHTHHKVKNYAAWEKPSQRFGVNGAWFKLALLAYNLVSAIIAAYLLDLIPIPLPNLPQPGHQRLLICLAP
jgi:hypothetical protein